MLKWWRLFSEHLISRSGHCVGVSRQDLGVVSRGARPALTRGQACCFISGSSALRPHSRLHRREIVSFVLMCRVKTHDVQGMRQGRRHKHRMTCQGCWERCHARASGDALGRNLLPRPTRPINVHRPLSLGAGWTVVVSHFTPMHSSMSRLLAHLRHKSTLDREPGWNRI